MVLVPILFFPSAGLSGSIPGMAIPLPLPSVADRVAGIIDALCRAVPTLIARDRSAGPLTILIYGRLRRLAGRFAALAARVAAGTLPAPRRRCPEMPAARPARPPRLLPDGFGWLARLVPGAACFGGQLQHLLLTDPEMASLLAAAPQAGRMLRSLLWMTAIRPLPEILRRPARQARSATTTRAAIPDLAGVPDLAAETDHVPAAGADRAPPEAPPRSRGRPAPKGQPPWLRSPEAADDWFNRLLGRAASSWPK